MRRSERSELVRTGLFGLRVSRSERSGVSRKTPDSDQPSDLDVGHTDWTANDNPTTPPTTQHE